MRQALLVAFAALSLAAAGTLWLTGRPSTRQHAPVAHAQPPVPIEQPDAQPPAAPDTTLERDREEYLAAVMAFTGESREDILAKMKRGALLMKDEWKAWESQGPMTPERTKAFYKQTNNYIYDLAQWHLFDTAEKRPRDLVLVDSIKKIGGVQTVLDFGCGVGFNWCCSRAPVSRSRLPTSTASRSISPRFA
jgi:hypothetical protein